MALPEAGPVAAETTWLEAITDIRSKQMPNGPLVLQFSLANGHRYCIPLMDGPSGTLEVVRKLVARVPVYGASDMPNRNGQSPG